MTWKEAWKRGAQSLQKAGVEEYDLDAWYLLEHVTGITKASYYMEPEHPMHDQEEREYLELIRKRSTRIPLQHLTGVSGVYGTGISGQRTRADPETGYRSTGGNSVGCVQTGTDGRNPTPGYVHRFRMYPSESPA